MKGQFSGYFTRPNTRALQIVIATVFSRLKLYKFGNYLKRKKRRRSKNINRKIRRKGNMLWKSAFPTSERRNWLTWPTESLDIHMIWQTLTVNVAKCTRHTVCVYRAATSHTDWFCRMKNNNYLTRISSNPSRHDDPHLHCCLLLGMLTNA